MKRVSLVTIFDNVNFGTYLQAIATATLIKKRGLDIELVHYIRKQSKNINVFMNALRKNFFSIKLPIRIIQKLKWINLRNKDWAFVKQYVQLSKKYYDFNDICNDPPTADIYMTGSDQVWNSIYNKGIDKTFYCAFAPKDKKLVAFSASIGMPNIPEDEKDETIELLARYSKITVREIGAKEILENLGLQNVDITLDPTLMLSGEDWNKLIPTDSFKSKEDFMLIYSVENMDQDKKIKDVCENISQLYGYKIYAIGGTRRRFKYADKVFPYVTPNLFVSLIRQAKFMIVSSFHGTAFAINFNKQFITVAPDRFNSRIDSILEICNLKKYKISSKDCNIPLDPIDFTKVNHILLSMREKSNILLDQMLSD